MTAVAAAVVAVVRPHEKSRRTPTNKRYTHHLLLSYKKDGGTLRSAVLLPNADKFIASKTLAKNVEI